MRNIYLNYGIIKQQFRPNLFYIYYLKYNGAALKILHELSASAHISPFGLAVTVVQLVLALQ